MEISPLLSQCLFRPDLSQKEWHREYAEELCGSSQEIETAKKLTADFYDLMKNGKIESLREWLNRAAVSGVEGGKEQKATLRV